MSLPSTFPTCGRDSMYTDTAHCANPEDASLEACEPSCGLRFGEVAITPFVILHARLGNEQLSVRECAHDIGQVVMGVALKSVANRERRVFRGRQSIGRGKLWANVTTRVVGNQWVVLQPEQEAFFQLATERLPGMRSCASLRASLEAGNPSRNGATRNFE